ncbi:nickel transporter permease [Desulforamulus ruminis]|uniref:nickel transporter permease n=1 Tax=Desulforamulus ruminis TaxID=1564 RepID=UPI002356B413|nr:nickel transporter permease [Desulforamulus ruminis]
MSQANAVLTTDDPMEQAYSPLTDFWRRLRKNKLAMVSLVFLVALTLVAVFAPLVAPYDPYLSDLPTALEGPSASHLLGNDELGRDIFSRIIYGARVSLKVGLIAVGIALSVGLVLGSLAGYYGGRLDNVIMRFMDIMLAFPSLLLAIALMAILGRGVENAIIAIGIVSIPEYARIVRGSVLSIKENEYVQAARAIGNRDLQIIFKHILPNVIAPIIVRATLGISTAILETSALGFLGLGVAPPIAEWGTMLGSGRGYMNNAPHLVFFPGIAITLTVMAFNLLGDGLRDALDPRLKR